MWEVSGRDRGRADLPVVARMKVSDRHTVE